MRQNRFWHLPQPQYFGISQLRQVLLAFACTKRGPSQKLSKRKGIVILYFLFFFIIIFYLSFHDQSKTIANFG